MFKLVFVFLLYTLYLILYPPIVYAGHCTPEEEAQRAPYQGQGDLDEYCASGIQRYRNLSNCTHQHIQNCPSGNNCQEQEILTPLDTPVTITRCVPGTAPEGTSTNEAAGLKQIEDVFRNVIRVVVGLGFIAALIMLIFAGFKYLTSGGEPKAVQAAHHAFSWALLGILFMAIAWLTLKLVEAFTNVPVTIFNIQNALPR